ncbi:MAG TPA: hypothetical protein VHS31_13180 [Tepidisphaeraceae bacterium]|jgi:hypothetical protein|nr:hypothetical protein [Tepidisphaeraceae bacterium]
MSYDLGFWRYKAGVKLEHQEVYEQLCDDQRVEGVEDLPIDKLILRFNELFTDWEKIDDVTFEGGDLGGFQLFTTRQFFRVICYNMSGEEMNKFVEIGIEFGCPLYDPQVGQRFEGE